MASAVSLKPKATSVPTFKDEDKEDVCSSWSEEERKISNNRTTLSEKRLAVPKSQTRAQSKFHGSKTKITSVINSAISSVKTPQFDFFKYDEEEEMVSQGIILTNDEKKQKQMRGETSVEMANSADGNSLEDSSPPSSFSSFPFDPFVSFPSSGPSPPFPSSPFPLSRPSFSLRSSEEEEENEVGHDITTMFSAAPQFAANAFVERNWEEEETEEKGKCEEGTREGRREKGKEIEEEAFSEALKETVELSRDCNVIHPSTAADDNKNVPFPSSLRSVSNNSSPLLHSLIPPVSSSSPQISLPNFSSSSVTSGFFPVRVTYDKSSKDIFILWNEVREEETLKCATSVHPCHLSQPRVVVSASKENKGLETYAIDEINELFEVQNNRKTKKSKEKQEKVNVEEEEEEQRWMIVCSRISVKKYGWEKARCRLVKTLQELQNRQPLLKLLPFKDEDKEDVCSSSWSEEKRKISNNRTTVYEQRLALPKSQTRVAKITSVINSAISSVKMPQFDFFKYDEEEERVRQGIILPLFRCYGQQNPASKVVQQLKLNSGIVRCNDSDTQSGVAIGSKDRNSSSNCIHSCSDNRNTINRYKINRCNNDSNRTSSNISSPSLEDPCGSPSFVESSLVPPPCMANVSSSSLAVLPPPPAPFVDNPLEKGIGLSPRYSPSTVPSPPTASTDFVDSTFGIHSFTSESIPSFSAAPLSPFQPSSSSSSVFPLEPPRMTTAGTDFLHPSDECSWVLSRGFPQNPENGEATEKHPLTLPHCFYYDFEIAGMPEQILRITVRPNPYWSISSGDPQ